MSARNILRSVPILLGMAMLLSSVSTPASAHKEHKKQAASSEAIQGRPRPGPPSTNEPIGEITTGPHDGAAVEHGRGSVMEDMDMGRSEMSFIERLITWIGRLHPFIVHFPIAFFPAALFTAIIGRRRPSFSAPVQFLVIAGGIFAPLAAAAGWPAGMSADPEPILLYHRWLGLLIGISGIGLAAWAWKRPWEDRGAGMIAGLTLMTIAIAAQGFMGAALTHGLDHLMF